MEQKDISWLTYYMSYADTLVAQGAGNTPGNYAVSGNDPTGTNRNNMRLNGQGLQ
jgi:beta-xylosidase